MSKNKVVVLSLSRTATQSTDLFLKDLGYKTIHWIEEEFNKKNSPFYNKKINDLTENDLDILFKHLGETYDAFSDFPFNYMYKYFDLNYETDFILIKRSFDEWYISFKKMYEASKGLDQKQKFNKNNFKFLQKYIGDVPFNVGSFSEEKLFEFYNNHHKNIEQYFKNKINLLTLDINDLEKTKKISEFLNIETKASFKNIDFWRGKL